MSNHPSDKKTGKSNRLAIVIVLVVIIVTAIGLIGGYLLFGYLSSPILGNQQDAIEKLANDIDSYPDAYVAAGMPQYPGTELISLSDKTDTPTQGISLIINTQDSPQAVAEYFDQQLVSSGWTAITNTNTASDPPYVKDYKRDNQTFSILINKASDQKYKSTATISWKSTE